MLVRKELALFCFSLISMFLTVSAGIENHLAGVLLKNAVYSAVKRKCGAKWGNAPKVLEQGSKKFLSQNAVQKLVRQRSRDFSPDEALVEKLSEQMCITGAFKTIPSTSLLSQVPVIDTSDNGSEAPYVSEETPVLQTSAELNSFDEPYQNTGLAFSAYFVIGALCAGSAIGALVTHYYLLLKTSSGSSKTLRRPEL